MTEADVLRQQLNRAPQLNRREENLIADWVLTTNSVATSPELLTRIVSAYRASGAAFEAAGDSMWLSFMKDNLEAHEILLANDAPRLARLFADPGRTNLFHGFDGLCASSLKWMAEDAGAKPKLALVTYDNLVRIAEAVGVLRMENPETYPFAEPRIEATEAILEKLDAAFGFRLDFPNPYPDECGIVSSRGVISYRATQAMFQAWRIATLLRERGGSRVAEIGAGLGRTAYYARRFGIGDYTIVDLPFSNASQAHFLGTALGGDAISLTGEPRAGVQSRS